MKKSTVYCSLIIMFFLSPIYSSQHSYHVVKNTGYQVQQINNPQYTLESKLLSKFYLTLEIPIITLKQKNSQKIIAQFQLPHELQQKELPQFSFNNKYLLILNAPWRLFYANQPSTYEWNLFDIDARKTIKTFPRESYPRFISKTEIQYNESQTYQIQQKYPGFLSKIINFFLPQKQNDASLIISQTNQINKEPQTNTVTPHTKTTPMSTTATTTLPIQIISNQTNEPIVRQTTTEEELEPIQSTADTQNQDIISYKRPQHHKTLLRTFNFLVKTAQLSPSVQLPIIKKYVSSLQSSPSYYKDIKAIMVTQSPVETSYNKALELLHTIETLSS